MVHKPVESNNFGLISVVKSTSMDDEQNKIAYKEKKSKIFTRIWSKQVTNPNNGCYRKTSEKNRPRALKHLIIYFLKLVYLLFI